MGNLLHKITNNSDENLVQELIRLNAMIAHLETTNTSLIDKMSYITTSSELPIEFVKEQGLRWMDDGFEEIQIRKFQSFLKKRIV
jgi:hypothetical protein